MLLEGCWAQEFFIWLYLGPMAQVEDEGLSEKDKSLAEEIVLLNKEVCFGHNSLRGWVEDKCILGYPKPRSEYMGCCPGECSKKFC